MTEQTPQTALVKVDWDKPVASMPELRKILSSVTWKEFEGMGLTKEKIIGFLTTAINKQIKLLDCTPMSIYQALTDSLRVGLDFSGSLGQAYLVPYGKVCTLIIGYQGYIQLMHRSGMIRAIYAEPVFEGDEFEYTLGTDKKIFHKPGKAGSRTSEAGLTHVYAVYETTVGGKDFIVMNRQELDAIRKRSKMANSGAWASDPIEMFKKVAIRRIRKYIPMSIEQQNVLSRVDEIDNTDYEVVQSDTVKRRATEENLEALGSLGKKKEVQPELIKMENGFVYDPANPLEPPPSLEDVTNVN